MFLGTSSTFYRASGAVSGSFPEPAAASKYLFLEVLSVYVFMSKVLQAVYVKFDTLLGTSSFLAYVSFVSQQMLGTKNNSLRCGMRAPN